MRRKVTNLFRDDDERVVVVCGARFFGIKTFRKKDFLKVNVIFGCVFAFIQKRRRNFRLEKH